MMHWLIQTFADHPALARAEVPEGMLSMGEQVRFQSLKRDKRRRDWLLGRWTAKRLTAQYIESLTGRRPALSDIVITTDPDGAPRLHSRNGYAFINRLAISISHSNGYAFCALTDVPGRRPGADIEYIEQRNPAFVSDFFARRRDRAGAPGAAIGATLADNGDLERQGSRSQVDPSRPDGGHALHCLSARRACGGRMGAGDGDMLP
jgi:phosphopantetheinyl transferase